MHSPINIIIIIKVCTASGKCDNKTQEVKPYSLNPICSLSFSDNAFLNNLEIFLTLKKDEDWKVILSSMIS